MSMALVVHLCLFDVSRRPSTLFSLRLPLQLVFVINKTTDKTIMVYLRNNVDVFFLCFVIENFLSTNTQNKKKKKKKIPTILLFSSTKIKFSLLTVKNIGPFSESPSNYVWTFCLWFIAGRCSTFIYLHEFSNSRTNNT